MKEFFLEIIWTSQNYGYRPLVSQVREETHIFSRNFLNRSILFWLTIVGCGNVLYFSFSLPYQSTHNQYGFAPGKRTLFCMVVGKLEKDGRGGK